VELAQRYFQVEKSNATGSHVLKPGQLSLVKYTNNFRVLPLIKSNRSVNNNLLSYHNNINRLEYVIFFLSKRRSLGFLQM
jgi:hypothetical protein